MLKTEVIKKRQTIYKYLDKGKRVYEIEAGDADTCEAMQEELQTILNNFINQQHESHMGSLAKVDSEIFHILAREDIVPSLNPSFDTMREENKKIFLSEIMKEPEKPLECPKCGFNFETLELTGEKEDEL